jgi:hypothetical protein
LDYAVLYKVPIAAKNSDNGYRSHGISGQVIRGVSAAIFH